MTLARHLRVVASRNTRPGSRNWSPFDIGAGLSSHWLLLNRIHLAACGATSHFPTRCTTAFDGATSILMSVRGTATVSSRTLRPA
jgi:hypothetical protein